MISFRHATVLACTGAAPVHDATVVVEGAVIKDVLTGARSAAGSGGEMVDCGGRTVLPGLIDAHVHVCTVEVDLAAQILATDAPRLSFVYLGAVDITGHAAGAGAAYREAARTADQRVGRLLAAIRSRSGYQDEGWTTVVITDHGHLDQGGHGGREPEVATAWAAAAGPGIRPGGPPPVTRLVQVAPLVLAALGALS